MKYINKKRLVDVFCELARIPSPSGQEEKITNVLIGKLEHLGLTVQKDTYGNIVAKLAGKGESIILCAHMDTVSIGEGKKINPVVKEDVITSDGTTILGADNKDSIAAIIEALVTIKENGLSHRSVEVVFTREEEAISRGAKNLDLSKLLGKECIISDSSELYGTITVSAPYCFRFDIEVIGKRSHPKEPEKGVNVAAIMAKAISLMPLGRIDEFTTSNIAFQSLGLKGIIDNPEKKIVDLYTENRNTVPDLGIILGEVRGAKIETVTNSLSQIESVFKEVAVSLGGNSSFKYDKLADGYFFEESDPLISMVSRIVSAQNVPIRYFNSIGGSDANILNARGIKTVVVSSAHRDNHKVTEYLVIGDLMKLANFYVQLLTNVE